VASTLGGALGPRIHGRKKRQVLQLFEEERPSLVAGLVVACKGVGARSQRRVLLGFDIAE
jgi:hypothetical protein